MDRNRQQNEAVQLALAVGGMRLLDDLDSAVSHDTHEPIQVGGMLDGQRVIGFCKTYQDNVVTCITTDGRGVTSTPCLRRPY